MFVPRAILVLGLFWLSTKNRRENFLSHSSLHLPKLLKKISYRLYAKSFPFHVNHRQMSLILLLCGDISLNPGPIKFAFANTRSIRNKGPLIGDLVLSKNIDIFALTETHIRPFDTPGLLRSLTPAGYCFHQKPREFGRGGGVGFLVRNSISSKLVDSPTYKSFENIVISSSAANTSIIMACVYRPPGSCSSSFLDDFLEFIGFLTSLSSNYFICGDFNVHLDTECRDKIKFSNLLLSCNLSQLVNKPTHLHGHILDCIIAPCDSDLISNVTVSDFISDHALINCHLDCHHTAASTSKDISYRRYHKIDMGLFRSELANISFVKSPECTASALHNQYVRGLSSLLDVHAPLINKKVKAKPAGWISDAFYRAKFIKRQWERRWRKDRSQLSRSNLRKQISATQSLTETRQITIKG